MSARAGRRAGSLRARFLRDVVLAAGDRVTGQGMVRRLRALERAQWWDAGRIRARRDELLRRVVETAWRDVPFYRDLLDSAGVRPADVRSPEDLAAIPIVTKDMLREGYPERVTRETGRRTYDAATSGSTGKNFYVREDAATAGWYRASFMLALGWAGWRIGEPHLQLGMTTARSLDRRLKDRFLGTIYASAARLDDASLDAHLDRLEADGVRHVWGYPGSVTCLARRARERGWRGPMSTVVTWGDTLFPHYRSEIEAAFGCRVTDTYGCAEGIQVAAQCGADARYHLFELDAVVEVVDGEGRNVAPGETGALILTRLHAGPMPLLRYRVGDAGALADPAERCPCGRGFALLEGIRGRDTDIVVTPSGNRLIVHYFTGILEHFREIDEFQVVQDDPAAIRVRVVPAAGYGPETAGRISEALRAGAPDLGVTVEPVSAIPLTPGGKRRFVIGPGGPPGPARGKH